MTYCHIWSGWWAGQWLWTRESLLVSLSHGHAPPLGNQLVAVTLARWRGSLWGYLPLCSSETPCAAGVRLQPSWMQAAGILACSTANTVVISQYQGTQLLSTLLELWKGPGRRTCQQVFLIPYWTFFCFWGANGKQPCTSSLYANMCLLMCDVGCWVVLVLWRDPVSRESSLK